MICPEYGQTFGYFFCGYDRKIAAHDEAELRHASASSRSQKVRGKTCC